MGPSLEMSWAMYETQTPGVPGEHKGVSWFERQVFAKEGRNGYCSLATKTGENSLG